MKKEKCHHCGQVINKEIFWKNMEKKFISWDLPSMAKVIRRIRKLK